MVMDYAAVHNAFLHNEDESERFLVLVFVF